MNFIESELQEFSVPIPRIFYSFEHDGMFRECSVCGADLINDNLHYFIEKAYRGTEVIFEYTMCENCRDTMEGEISAESMMNISNFFFERLDVIAERQELMNTFDNSVKQWLDNCIFTGEKRTECDSYQICAQCHGKELTVSFLPLMISTTVAEEIQELMSKKTKSSFDGFIKDTLNPPVDFKDIPVLI